MRRRGKWRASSRRAAFGSLLQEGSEEKIFTEAIGDHWLVSVIFGRHTHLGLVKVLV